MVGTHAATPSLTAARLEKETVTQIPTALETLSVAKTTVLDLALTGVTTAVTNHAFLAAYVPLNQLRELLNMHSTNCLKIAIRANGLLKTFKHRLLMAIFIILTLSYLKHQGVTSKQQQKCATW